MIGQMPPRGVVSGRWTTGTFPNNSNDFANGKDAPDESRSEAQRGTTEGSESRPEVEEIEESFQKSA